MKTLVKRAIDWDNLSPAGKDWARKAGIVAEDAALAAGSLLGFSLTRLARIANTKDFGGWGSTAVYDRLFRPIRWQKLSVLEIGVGGYDDNSGGRSLRLWRSFFPRADIAALDLYDKTCLSRGRVQVFQGSQVDRAVLDRIAHNRGGFDIVIDDGSHINEHQIRSFEILFPHLRAGGIYVVEDTQTSYWEGFGGGTVGSEAHGKSCVTYFKNLIDGLNHAEFPNAGYTPTRYDLEIVSIQFVHNLIIIEKGNNAAPSNIIGRWDAGIVRAAGKIDHAGKITTTER
jgi:hypothetical protein